LGQTNELLRQLRRNTARNQSAASHYRQGALDAAKQKWGNKTRPQEVSAVMMQIVSSNERLALLVELRLSVASKRNTVSIPCNLCCTWPQLFSRSWGLFSPAT
jgi:hypothetical protein